MIELVKYIVENLTTEPENILVTQEGDTITAHIPKKDIGKVIGRQGRIAKSIRTILKAACAGETKITLDIVEIEEPSAE